MGEIIQKHHSFAPSSLERCENCPPSWKICSNMVRDNNSKDAERGELMHRAFYDDSALDLLNEKDQELISELRKSHINLFKGKGYEHFHELFVEIKDKQGNTLTSGWLDYLILSPNKAVGSLIDLKYGSYEVTPAAENPQIWAYVAGCFQKFPQLQEIFALIVQPVFGVGNFDNQTVFHRADLDKIIERIENIEKKCKDADTSNFQQYNPSPDDCRYCNKMQCPVHRLWMIENMRIMGFTEHDLPKEVVEMTVEYADRVKLAEKAITEQMETLSAMAATAIKNFGGSEHYRVCNGKVSKTVNWKALCEKHNITEDDIAEFTLVKMGEPYVTARTRKTTKHKEIEV